MPAVHRGTFPFHTTALGYPPTSLRLNSKQPGRKRFSLTRGRFYVPSVIDRYSRPEMSKIWSDQRKFEIWLEIEVLACEVMALRILLWHYLGWANYQKFRI